MLPRQSMMVWDLNTPDRVSNKYRLISILGLFNASYVYVSMYSLTIRVNNEDVVTVIRCDHTDIIYILIILSLPPSTTAFTRWHLIIPVDSFIINIDHIMSKHADSMDDKLTTLSELLPKNRRSKNERGSSFRFSNSENVKITLRFSLSTQIT